MAPPVLNSEVIPFADGTTPVKSNVHLQVYI